MNSSKQKNRIRKLEDGSFEIIKSEEQKEKEGRKVKRTYRIYEIQLSRLIYALWECQKKRQRKGQRIYLKRKWWKCPKFEEGHGYIHTRILINSK